MKNIYVRSIVVICAICLVMGLALAGVYALTQPEILKNEREKTEKAMKEFFPEAQSFVLVFDKNSKPADAPKSLLTLYVTEDGAGYVATILTNSGYGQSTFICGINTAPLAVVGVKQIEYKDTVSLDDAYLPSFAGQGKDMTDVDSSASPAKYTKQAIKGAILDVMNYLEGSESERAAKIMANMFPDKTLTPVFEQETRPAGTPENILSLYKTEDGEGYAAVICTFYYDKKSTYVVGIDAKERKIIALNYLSYQDSVDVGSDFIHSFAGQDKDMTDVDTSASPAPSSKRNIKGAVTTLFTYMDDHQLWTEGE